MSEFLDPSVIGYMFELVIRLSARAWKVVGFVALRDQAVEDELDI